MPNKPRQKSKKRPKYMYLFNDLLKRHNDAQPKFFSKKGVLEGNEKRKKEIEKEKEKPSLSYSNTSTPSIDPAKVSSYTQSAAPTISNKASSEFGSDKDSSSRLTAISSPFSSQDNQQEQSDSRNLSNYFDQLEKERKKLDPAQVNGATYAELPPSRSPRLQQRSQPQQPTTTTSMSIDRPSLPSFKLSTTTTSSQRASELLKNSKKHFKDSAPNVSQAPTAVMGNSSTQQHKHHPGSKKKIAHSSIAKTIAEQTPNAFKTLGPGFNAKAPAEKSFNPLATITSSLSGFTLPSDYEHIFHAPSQISDLATSSKSSEQKRTNSPKMNANRKTNNMNEKKTSHKAPKTAQGQTNRGSSKKR